MTTQTYTGTLVVKTCGSCGTTYGLSDETNRCALADDRVLWRCTNPECAWDRVHCTDTELSRTKRELEQARRWSELNRIEAANERSRREIAERGYAAQKGVTTKLRKRIAAGVCPCCNRTFENLARHVARQHPKYAKET